jgi:hypothetical protein
MVCIMFFTLTINECDLIKLAYCLYTLFETESLWAVNDSPSLALEWASGKSQMLLLLLDKSWRFYLVCPRQKGPMHCNHAGWFPMVAVEFKKNFKTNMPQLDTLTYFPQYLWLVIFASVYYFVIEFIIPSTASFKITK